MCKAAQNANDDFAAFDWTARCLGEWRTTHFPSTRHEEVQRLVLFTQLSNIMFAVALSQKSPREERDSEIGWRKTHAFD